MMNAFISYSHQDSNMLDLLHKHLAQLRRENIINDWTDRDIMPGGKLDQNISSALSKAKLFIALLSPDYIASNYCYEKEFTAALKLQEGGLIIIPVIVEPCDWLNTPLRDFKALPKDGKAVSNWENTNNAFLDVIQNIRRLIEASGEKLSSSFPINQPHNTLVRNYRVQKDFDSIEKIEFAEKSMVEVKEYIKRYMEEVVKLENIKSRIFVDNDQEFECILVNRNKIATESHLRISIGIENASSMFSTMTKDKQLLYSISKGTYSRQEEKTIRLTFDEFHLFWTQESYHSRNQKNKELTSKDIADLIWSEWLESVGIL